MMIKHRRQDKGQGCKRRAMEKRGGEGEADKMDGKRKLKGSKPIQHNRLQHDRLSNGGCKGKL